MAHGKMILIREKVDESHGGNVVFQVLVGNPNGNIQRTILNSGGKCVKSCRTGNLQHRPLEINGVHPKSVIQRWTEKVFQTGKPDCMSAEIG